MPRSDSLPSGFDPSQQLIGEPLYRETQKRLEWWVYGIVAIVPATVWGLFIGQIVLGRSIGSPPMSDLGMIITWIIGGIAFPVLMWSMRLVVEVWPHEVRIRWIPIWKRTIALEQIKTVEPVVYRPLLDCGGWGIRLSRQHGWAYTISGREGVSLELSHGKKVLIGSRDPVTLCAMIEQHAPGGHG